MKCAQLSCMEIFFVVNISNMIDCIAVHHIAESLLGYLQIIAVCMCEYLYIMITAFH